MTANEVRVAGEAIRYPAGVRLKLESFRVLAHKTKGSPMRPGPWGSGA